jgi:hypothetical protein
MNPGFRPTFCQCPIFPILTEKYLIYFRLNHFYNQEDMKMTDLKEKGSIKKRIGACIIGNAIVWGIVIIATALVLRGTGLFGKLLPILGGGAAFSEATLSGLLVGKK